MQDQHKTTTSLQDLINAYPEFTITSTILPNSVHRISYSGQVCEESYYGVVQGTKGLIELLETSLMAARKAIATIDCAKYTHTLFL